MRSTILTFMFAVGLPAVAAETPAPVTAPPSQPLQLRPKSALESSAPTHKSAPFVSPNASEADLFTQPKMHEEKIRPTCASSSALCYDPTARTVVYKPARALMPSIPGLRAENISVRRDRVTFRYSF